jgi:hypothetical protein
LNIIKLLRKEESKLAKQADVIVAQVKSIRTAIDALGGKPDGRRGPRKCRKLSAAHRRAIKEGIARRKAEKKQK